MTRQVFIDGFEEGLARQPADRTVVVVDIIRASTTAIVAVDRGHRCFPTASLDHATALASTLDDPILAGELGGYMPYDFDISNSPASVVSLQRADRPLILLSSSGSTLMVRAATRPAPGYVASLQNLSAMAERLGNDGRDVALIGAGSRGEFREEDQYGCAQIAGRLLGQNWEPGDPSTSELCARWYGRPVESFLESHSVEYLRKTDQLNDLAYITSHVDDVQHVFRMVGIELVREQP